LTIEFLTNRDIPRAPLFRPLLEMARYEGAWGDRGSGNARALAVFLARHRIEEERKTSHDPGTGMLN